MSTVIVANDTRNALDLCCLCSCVGSTFAMNNFETGTVINAHNAKGCQFVFNRIDRVKLGTGQIGSFNGNKLLTGNVGHLRITAESDSFQGSTIDTRGATNVKIKCGGSGSCEGMIIKYMPYHTRIEVICSPGACKSLTFFMEDTLTADIPSRRARVAEREKIWNRDQGLQPWIFLSFVDDNGRALKHTPFYGASSKEHFQLWGHKKLTWKAVTIQKAAPGEKKRTMKSSAQPIYMANRNPAKNKIFVDRTIAANDADPVKIFVVDVDQAAWATPKKNRFTLTGGQKVDFIFQRGLAGIMSDALEVKGAGTIIKSVEVTSIAGEATGELLFDIARDVTMTGAATVGILVAGTVGTTAALAVATGGLSLVPIIVPLGFKTLEMAYSWTIRLHEHAEMDGCIMLQPCDD